ncbi:MAG: hypothetical protein Ct9H300mP7_4940 [Verrucomicrobiota bacterium]|nr:MAG: hypothetical protein Ct9H300mP7_4940 [Verrucomicrobiota bacterium]
MAGRSRGVPWPVADDRHTAPALFEWTRASLKLPGNARKLKGFTRRNWRLRARGTQPSQRHRHHDLANGSARPDPHLQASSSRELTGTGGLIYTLYDLGLRSATRCEHSGCVNIANDDMKTKTSLIESAYYGDTALFERFCKRLEAKCVRNHVDDYLQMRIGDQDKRRVKFGNSALLQEPNIKNGAAACATTKTRCG